MAISLSVGLGMNVAKAAFSEYLDGANLDSRQIYFVNQIVDYIVYNGMMPICIGIARIESKQHSEESVL